MAGSNGVDDKVDGVGEVDEVGEEVTEEVDKYECNNSNRGEITERKERWAGGATAAAVVRFFDGVDCDGVDGDGGEVFSLPSNIDMDMAVSIALPLKLSSCDGPSWYCWSC